MTKKRTPTKPLIRGILSALGGQVQVGKAPRWPLACKIIAVDQELGAQANGHGKGNENMQSIALQVSVLAWRLLERFGARGNCTGQKPLGVFPHCGIDTCSVDTLFPIALSSQHLSTGKSLVPMWIGFGLLPSAISAGVFLCCGSEFA